VGKEDARQILKSGEVELQTQFPASKAQHQEAIAGLAMLGEAAEGGVPANGVKRMMYEGRPVLMNVVNHVAAAC
jgi:hypothetical protein